MMKDDTIKYVLSSTDGKGDFISLPRKFVQGCQMEPRAFEELFFSMCDGVKSNTKAYHEAEDIHVKVFGKQKYSDYQSFKTQRSKRKK
jgi:hypothetical protein